MFLRHLKLSWTSISCYIGAGCVTGTVELVFNLGGLLTGCHHKQDKELTSRWTMGGSLPAVCYFQPSLSLTALLANTSTAADEPRPDTDTSYIPWQLTTSARHTHVHVIHPLTTSALHVRPAVNVHTTRHTWHIHVHSTSHLYTLCTRQRLYITYLHGTGTPVVNVHAA